MAAFQFLMSAAAPENFERSHHETEIICFQLNYVRCFLVYIPFVCDMSVLPLLLYMNMKRGTSKIASDAPPTAPSIMAK